MDVTIQFWEDSAGSTADTQQEFQTNFRGYFVTNKTSLEKNAIMLGVVAQKKIRKKFSDLLNPPRTPPPPV